MDVEGSGRFWQYLQEDQSLHHIVSEVPSQPRAPRANFYDPVEPWETNHHIHHTLRPGRPASKYVGLVTPRFIGVEAEDELEVLYPGGDAYHVARKVEGPGISAMAEPDKQDTEMEVEVGSKVEGRGVCWAG